MPLISVIVPVYKVKDYLHRCVDSILSQSFESFELILIDDGSPDECGEICDSYAAKDNRVIVIHQQNHGQATARNVGIDWAMENSNSEWIAFIDSDDWIQKDYLKLLFEATHNYNVDLSICNCIKTSDFSVDSFELSNKVKIFSPEDFWCFRQYGGPWAKLYKKTIFNEIRFPDGLIYEDVFVIYRTIFMQKKIVYIEDPLYFYCIREGSTVRIEWNPRVLSQLAGMKEQIRFFKTNHYKNALEVTKRNFLYDIKNQYEASRRQKKQYFKEYFHLKLMFKYYLIKYHKYVPIKKHINLFRSGLPFFTLLYKKYTYLLECKQK